MWQSRLGRNYITLIKLRSGVSGVVMQYDDVFRYGFISLNDNIKAFFDESEVLYEHVQVGDEVKCDLFMGPMGHCAASVKLLGTEVLLELDATGVVIQYLNKPRYGFIYVNDKYSKVLFITSAIQYRSVKGGDKVEFDLHKGPRGYCAKNIKLLNRKVDSKSNRETSDPSEGKLIQPDVTGAVEQYSSKRCHGFIIEDNNDTLRKVYFHISAVSENTVRVGDKVTFHLNVGPKGYFAESVKILNESDDNHRGQNKKYNGTKHGRYTDKMHHEGAGKTTSHDTSRISREKGNTFFKSARDLGSDAAKLDVYKSARECYKKAYASSLKDDDLVSAAKNIGTVSWKIAKLKMNSSSDERKEIHAYFKDALKCFSTAYTKRNCMVQEWAQHLEKSIRECLDDIKTWIAPRNDDDRIVFLKEYVAYLPECAAKVSCFLHIATIYFRKGKDALKHHEYKKCQGYMDECSTTLNEAKKRCAGMDQSFRVNITDLEKDVQHQKDVVQKCLSKAKDDQARRAQEEKEAREKEEALDQLKGDLNKLERLKKKLPIEEFVEQVYKKWPPKGADGLKTPCASSSTSSSSGGSKRKLLIRAISQYHPDKVDKNAHGVKWYVMSGEITKCLNLLLTEVDT